jgi:hypothetical protein
LNFLEKEMPGRAMAAAENVNKAQKHKEAAAASK